ncbi:MAG: hypothetical protein AAF658_18810, partial [Myxococcota bacterium]
DCFRADDVLRPGAMSVNMRSVWVNGGVVGCIREQLIQAKGHRFNRPGCHSVSLKELFDLE